MIALFVALAAVACLGLMAVAIAVVDWRLDEYLRRIEHTCTPLCVPADEIHFTETGWRIA